MLRPKNSGNQPSIKSLTAEIVKSSRHSKIVGQFGEALICNWLSRSGFESAIVDHTGLDIIAFNPKTNARLGISVKSRARNRRRERTYITLFDVKKGDRQKMIDACKAFNCEPWHGIYAETTDHADIFLTSLNHYEQVYGRQDAKRLLIWHMSKKATHKYQNDPNIYHMAIKFDPQRWF